MCNCISQELFDIENRVQQEFRRGQTSNHARSIFPTMQCTSNYIIILVPVIISREKCDLKKVQNICILYFL